MKLSPMLKRMLLIAGVGMLATTAYGAGLDTGANDIVQMIKDLSKYYYMIMIPLAGLVIAVTAMKFYNGHIDWIVLATVCAVTLLIAFAPKIAVWLFKIAGHQVA